MDENRFDAIMTNGSLPDPKSIDVNGIIEDLWKEYVDSTDSLLSEIEASALAIDTGKNVNDNIANVKRILHSIKGEAGMIGANDIHELCHTAESALEDVTDYSTITDMVLKVKDWIHEAMKYVNLNENKNKQNKNDKNAKKLRVLIVDDMNICRKRVKMLLKDLFDCTFAANGREALEMYQQSMGQNSPYNLITLDINMPEMNGHETLIAIRKTEEEHGITGLDGVKVIMTTTEDNSKHIFNAFREGCEAYVVKEQVDKKLLEEITKLGLLQEQKQYSVK
ncbi:MAG: response regulator [Planctomycetes bacterium]|nr:response regulator [Planctomycetota bacterium]